VESINATSQDTKTPIHFLTYYDPLYGIKIQYPSDWLLDESEPFSYDEVTKIIGFIKNPDAFAGDFLISVHNLSNKYMNQSIDLNTLLNHTIDYYKEYYRNFKLIDGNTNVTLGNISNDAYKLVWIDTDRQYTIQNMQIGTIIGNKAYLIRYYAKPEEFSTNISVIDRMLESLRILDKSAEHIDGVNQ
jgi:serine/threonine-protein kinase